MFGHMGLSFPTFLFLAVTSRIFQPRKTALLISTNHCLRYYFFFLFRVSLNPASINIHPGTRQSQSQRRNGPRQSPPLVRWFVLLPRNRVLPPPRWSCSKHNHSRWYSINAMIFNTGTKVNFFICEIYFRQYAPPGRVGVERGKRGRFQGPSPCEEALSEGLQRWKWDSFLF